MSHLSCRVGMGEIRELLDGKIWEWDLSFRWEWDGNKNEVIEMGGNWYKKICSRTPLIGTTHDDHLLVSITVRTWLKLMQ